MSIAIASVILISITIASALAVTSWVGVISVNFMETEELWVSDVTYQGTSRAADNQITVTLANSSIDSITIIKARITGSNVDMIIENPDVTINPGERQTVTISDVGWVAGYTYKFDFLTARGNNFITTDSA